MWSAEYIPVPHSDFRIAYLLILTAVCFCVKNPKFVAHGIFGATYISRIPLGRKKKRSQLFREVGKYAALGLEMAISVVIGLVIGAFLDKRLKTGPWLTLLFLMLGFAAGLRSLIRAALKSQREMNNEEESDRKP
jgi:ATP synthase protein I